VIFTSKTITQKQRANDQRNQKIASQIHFSSLKICARSAKELISHTTKINFSFFYLLLFCIFVWLIFLFVCTAQLGTHS